MRPLKKVLTVSVFCTLCVWIIFILRYFSMPSVQLFPDEDPYSDRIIQQMAYIPPNYDQIKQRIKLKSILLYDGLEAWNVKQGREVFIQSQCPVHTCELTPNRERANTAALIIYKDLSGIQHSANSRQLTMVYNLESPYYTAIGNVPNAINWTATYRSNLPFSRECQKKARLFEQAIDSKPEVEQNELRDSDIVTPYEKWQYYNPKIRQIEHYQNFAANKTKKVAWLVSNCFTPNKRLQLAHEIQKYIEVDIYGACGKLKCPRSTADKCFEMLERDYKFYLAFENSNCKDYITEKFFVNALGRNILPIVMGARPEDYEISAPHRSYIHVDEFSSPKELATYLHMLDQNDELYNSYFKWKGTGHFINTFFWCRVCAMLHHEMALHKSRWYLDINAWWNWPGICTTGSWRNFTWP